ncbi:damage-inducible protein CinA [Methylomonas sp. LWB]|uniref:CinA family protein n=1 Tax=Methylomonas sp. LWB TaxID=1905845 RepID=UPI0008DA10C7|nr:CinA family protein [Methylomonas sp. LWB]OHX36784.1 damage-inducible protein CinA [Methylomonas sp. LWB]
MTDDAEALAARLGAALKQRGWRIAVAESCTGGGIAHAITEVAGSSEWFDRGFVTYSNAAKVELLGVPQTTLDSVGAVSPETALAMVAGALNRSQADLAVAVTGIAGPGGGTPDKPVGLVYIALQSSDQPACCQRQQFQGSRRDIRRQTVAFALQWALQTAAPS